MESLVRELAYLFLAFMIGYITWFFPWYTTWLVPLAAMVTCGRLRWAIVAYPWSVLALYAFPRVVLDRPVSRSVGSVPDPDRPHRPVHRAIPRAARLGERYW